MPARKTNWPVLNVAPGRIEFFAPEGLLVFPDRIPVSSRTRLLEEAETALARQKTFSGDLSWLPPSPQASGFLNDCIRLARQKGGMRIFCRENLDLPLEALRIENMELGRSLPLQRLVAQSRPFQEIAGGEPLVYCNPAPDLPCIDQEAAQSHQILGRGDFICRTLLPEEWWQRFSHSRIIFYFGHGRIQDGLPLIPGRSGWHSFLPPSYSGRRLIVFSACLEGEGLFQIPDAAFLGPICRIADRPSDFILDFARDFVKTGDSAHAFFKACQLDFAHNDIRRFLFRISGYFSGSIDNAG